MMNKGLFTSARSDWETPQAFFDGLNEEFGFTLDVCSGYTNHKAEALLAFGAFLAEWTGVCWMNPPYGREIGKWIQKAWESAQGGATVVCLLPSRTDTAWWHDYVMKADEIRFIRGRLKFSGHKNNAPFPSAVVVFRPRKERG